MWNFVQTYEWFESSEKDHRTLSTLLCLHMSRVPRDRRYDDCRAYATHTRAHAHACTRIKYRFAPSLRRLLVVRLP